MFLGFRQHSRIWILNHAVTKSFVEETDSFGSFERMIVNVSVSLWTSSIVSNFCWFQVTLLPHSTSVVGVDFGRGRRKGKRSTRHIRTDWRSKYKRRTSRGWGTVFSPWNYLHRVWFHGWTELYCCVLQSLADWSSYLIAVIIVWINYAPKYVMCVDMWHPLSMLVAGCLGV